MALLVVNCGSSSIKLSLFAEKKRLLDMNAPHKSFKGVLKKLINECDVEAVAHRFVHGGGAIDPLLACSEKEIGQLKKLLPLDPLHNPLCYEGVVSAFAIKKLPQIIVFDTSFFHDLPEVATTYALPAALIKKHSIRRFGFHGLAHEALAQAVPAGRVIIAHLGSGCSLTALKNGKPIDTSMGFTPLEGLVMATRPGDLDPGLVTYLSRREKDLEDILHHQSGLLGLGGSCDMQQILKKRSSLALDLFCYRAQKYIGAYAAALEGLDSLIFSGGIGENCPRIRHNLCPAWLGAKLDPVANRKAVALTPGEKRQISDKKSKIRIYVIGSDENRLIAEKATPHLP